MRECFYIGWCETNEDCIKCNRCTKTYPAGMSENDYPKDDE